MDTREYRFIDKSEWDRGPWDNEPDKVQWQDVATGLPCIARRSAMGFWCGYVGVAEGHPYFEREYDSGVVDLTCHGGLTFNAHCAEDDKEHGICHVPAPGEPDNVWWLGFDCGHAFDLMPGTVAALRKCDAYHGDFHQQDAYRDLDYVKSECAQLAQQLAAVHDST